MDGQPRVIPLAKVPPAPTGWGRPGWHVALWRLAEWAVVSNTLQPSSALRAAVLRRFGARIGTGVVIRPRVRVRFPWNLEVGDDCWIGEGVWISNRERVLLEHDVVLSQETFVTTGSHDARRDMKVVARPVVVRAGAWVTTRCIVLGGVEIGTSAVVTPGTVVRSDVPAGMVVGQPEPQVLRARFPD